MSDPVNDLHIDDFCKDCAKIWLLLYKRFPTKMILYVEDISGPDTPDEFGLHSPRFEACFSTMVWLKEADYLQYTSTIKQEAVEEATLSHRCFSLLAAYDTALMGESATTTPVRRIDHLKEVMKHGTSEDLKGLVLRFMMESRQFN